MSVFKTVDGAAATGAGSVYSDDGRGGATIVAVTAGTFVGTVKIEGSVDGTNYVELASNTANDVDTVAMLPYMRGNVSAYTSGAVEVDFLIYD